MENIERKRLTYLDMVKGFGILLVILGHTYPDSNSIKIWIYSFHMPLFFIISGILLNHTNTEDKDIKSIIISKFKSLIIPYIFFELLAIFIWMILNEFTLNALRWNIIDSLLMYTRAGATWFLPCLFVAELLFIVLRKNIKNDYILMAVSLILFLIPLIVNIDNHYIIVVLRCFIALGFLTLGYYSYKYIIKSSLSYRAIGILVVINIILSYINGYVDLWSLTFNNQFIYIVCSVIGSFSLILLFKKVKEINMIKYFGTNTLIIMSTHQMILNIIIVKFTNMDYYGYIVGIGIFLLIALMEIPIIHIINNYIPFMIGKSIKKA